MAHVVTQPCCNDASCVAVCPVDCIHPTPAERAYISTEMLFIDPQACIDCGACVDECPVDAIVPPEDLTAATEPYAEINAAYYTDRAATEPEPEPEPQPALPPDTLRVAIVGSGPSACYVADALGTTRGLAVEITVLEKLPAPGGLVRYGVAPDHASTKGITSLFARTLARRNTSVHLNTEVGVHISHEELLRHHHAVVYASGASGDRALGIPGEELPGSVSAREFVAWYNGHPDHADRPFDLSGERAVVVGNGNVALDVARILVRDADALTRTDIATHALEALASSNIREVVVVGRRGPEHAAFSTPELLGLGSIPGVEVTSSHSFDDRNVPDEPTRIRAAVLERYHATDPTDGARRIHLQFHRTPVELTGETSVDGVHLTRSATDPSTDGPGGTARVDAGLVIRSVGFHGRPLPDLPFDPAAGVLPNENGAVIDPATGDRVRGVYTAGWLKRGPSGVIGSNKPCSERTAAAIVADFAAGLLDSPTCDGVAFEQLLSERHPDRVPLSGWRALDTHERKTGRTGGRPRVKVVDRLDMVEIALGRSVAGAR